MVAPTQWGKYFWTCMHLTAVGYPETPSSQEREDYKAFFLGFGKILPCSKCRGNFARHCEELPIELYMFGRQQLFDWTVRLHNIVNGDLGKPKWTYEEAWQYYTKGIFEPQTQLSKNSDNAHVLLLLNTVLLIVLTITIVFVAFRHKK